MNFQNAPQPIPYQGSKRLQVPVILHHLPKDAGTLWEPFVGSGAVTIGAAFSRAANRFVLGDTLEPLVGIWRLILEDPSALCDGYEALWLGQLGDPRTWYDQIRDRFNEERKPDQLLYLIARCVKNAIRFNVDGRFNQSPDNRRLGMKPSLLRIRVSSVHEVLAGKTQAICADYGHALRTAAPADVVYMDPPYMGVSGKRDSRYHEVLDLDRFIRELGAANERNVSYLVSFDGRCGDRIYGETLPASLDLDRIEVHVGRSSQATLNGRTDETVESLYISQALRRRLQSENVMIAANASVKTPPTPSRQDLLSF